MPRTHEPENGISEASLLLLDRGLLGLVWLDEDLTPRRCQGRLAEWVPLDVAYSDALPMLVGYEPELESLRNEPSGSVILPNVGLPGLPGTVAKFDMRVLWLQGPRQFLIVLQHESSQGALQLELHHEIARRQVAESREAQLARSLQQANAELTRANKDLESFAYIISHDLRAPLRAMRYTAENLQAELGDGLQDGAREQLAQLRLLSRRMGAMMSGLLEYARIGRKQEAIQAVDTGRLVRDILVGVGAPPGLQIVCEGAWPELTTLSEPLDVILRNLIENAVKHHDTKRGVIVLRATEFPDQVRFDVEDDGPGIDPDYHAAIFEPFRTVAGEETSESSGIGLALVRKTAEVAGGRVEVASDPARRRGTRFSVFWPRQVKEA